MHQINGRMYGHLAGLDFCQGDKILWHSLVIGSETDIHAMYFHGNEFEIDGNHKDTLNLFPGYIFHIKKNYHSFLPFQN